MFKKMLNEASITFQIEATGPILIKDGKIDDEMRFVVDANDEIFIPGSSIRGVWRSWCEKIARTISEKDVPLSWVVVQTLDRYRSYLKTKAF